MADVTDAGSDLHVRQATRKRTGEVHVADFTMVVRVPGKPAALRVYTDEERDEAARYATGGVVVPLPLSPPAGYITGPGGSLMPSVSSPEDRPLP
jgi:hypothetical protein